MRAEKTSALQECFQTREHHAPVLCGVLTGLLRRIVVLGQGDTGPPSVGRQFHCDDVVVLRQMIPLSSYARHCHSPFHTMGLPTTHSDVTLVPNMYALIAAGVTSASHTSATGAVMVADTLAIDPVFIGIPEPRGLSCSHYEIRGDRQH